MRSAPPGKPPEMLALDDHPLHTTRNHPPTSPGYPDPPPDPAGGRKPVTSTAPLTNGFRPTKRSDAQVGFVPASLANLAANSRSPKKGGGAAPGPFERRACAGSCAVNLFDEIAVEEAVRLKQDGRTPDGGDDCDTDCGDGDGTAAERRRDASITIDAQDHAVPVHHRVNNSDRGVFIVLGDVDGVLFGAPEDIDADRFRLKNTIGNGAFSNIYTGTDKYTKQRVAIKCIDKLANFAAADESEYAISSQLSHEHIIRCLGRYFGADARQYLVFELANQGDLFDVLRASNFQMPFAERLRYLRQTAAAIDYLHGRGVVHLDIKLENILLHNGLVKVCDFGLSGLQGTVRRGTPHGTSSYMPPEYLGITKLETEYVMHCAADTWAFGIVIFAVAFGDLPWDRATCRNHDYTEFKAWGRSVGRLEPFVFLGVGIRKAVVSCLQANPADRMPMSQVLALIDETDELILMEFQDI